MAETASTGAPPLLTPLTPLPAEPLDYERFLRRIRDYACAVRAMVWEIYSMESLTELEGAVSLSAELARHVDDLYAMNLRPVAFWSEAAKT